MVLKDGITTPALFRCGCRGGKSYGGSAADAAHLTTFAKSPDSRSRRRGRCATVDTPRSRYRTYTGRPNFSRTCPLGAITGCSGIRSCSPGRSSRQAMLLEGFSDRPRIDVDARSLADLAK